jgi:hypothetical protein
MLGIKSQPLDDGEVPLFMSFYNCQREAPNCLPWTKAETVIYSSQNQARARWKLSRQLCRENERIWRWGLCLVKERIADRGGVLFKTQMNSTMLQSLISLSGVVESCHFLMFQSPSSTS